MGYLDTYGVPLSSKNAAHLLRRATFGPTSQEIIDFTGLTATQAVDLLITNCEFRKNPPPPVELDGTRADVGETIMDKPLTGARAYEYFLWLRYWWIGLMTEQLGRPAILEKLTAFWQNHFVVQHSTVGDYRITDMYIRYLRDNALGDFRTLVIGMTKHPGMLIFQNGQENSKGTPNENYARELQELFTVGQKNFAGEDNYTEADVKAAAKVLTGWQVVDQWKPRPVGINFNLARHDVTDKTFSGKYNNTVIRGKNSSTAGDEELSDLTTMLLSHPETPKFICRKLYRWYVNNNVTQEIEDQVIVPLASFFASSGNNYQIVPVIKKLLTSNIFYSENNIGAIIKSPAEFLIGMMRHLNQPVPDMNAEPVAFRKMMQFIEWGMNTMQLRFLDQPAVFGSVPYYQTGYSKNWINGTSLATRGQHSDAMIWPWLELLPGYKLGIDFYQWIKDFQPNFANVSATPSVTCEQVYDAFAKDFFAIEPTPAKRDFLIDTIMMRGIPRTSWINDLNRYRANTNDAQFRNNVIGRCQTLVHYMFRMAEYQVF